MTEKFTAETAAQFNGFSVANAVKVESALPCGCKAYVDVFTYRRWQAQGFQVQRGEKAIKIPVVKVGTTEDRDVVTGETQTRSWKKLGTGAVFCRHQVKPIDSGK